MGQGQRSHGSKKGSKQRQVCSQQRQVASFDHSSKKIDEVATTASAVSSTTERTEAPPPAPAETNSHDAVSNNATTTPSQPAPQDSEAYDGSTEDSPHTFQVVILIKSFVCHAKSIF